MTTLEDHMRRVAEQFDRDLEEALRRKARLDNIRKKLLLLESLNGPVTRGEVTELARVMLLMLDEMEL